MVGNGLGAQLLLMCLCTGVVVVLHSPMLRLFASALLSADLVQAMPGKRRLDVRNFNGLIPFDLTRGAGAAESTVQVVAAAGIAVAAASEIRRSRSPLRERVCVAPADDACRAKRFIDPSILAARANA